MRGAPVISTLMPDNFSDTGRASTVDYAALPGPGGRRSLIPPVDARWWTLKVALSQRPWSFLASGAMAVAFVCNGVTPVVVGRAVDDAVTTASIGRLAFWIGVLAGVFLVAILANWTARFMLVRSQQLVSHDLRTQVTDRIQDPRGFAGRDRTPGGLLSIASSDTTRVGDIVMMTVMPVAEAAAIIYGAAVMYTINPWLSLGTLIGGPLLAVVALRVARPLQTRSVARQQAIAEAAATATDVVQGLRILKGLGAVDIVRGRYRSVSDEAYARTVDANAAQARLNVTTESTGSLYVIVIAVAAAWLALQGRLSIGELITIIGLTQFIIMPMTMLGKNIASRWAAAQASAARIREVLDAPYELGPEHTGVPDLPPGLSVVTGHAPEQLILAPRDRVIVAPHSADLFEGSVLANVHPDPDRARAALHTAAVEDLPGGPEREVGENGRNLSGGQRQRVALARAVAADAEVLVLQDPTTAVDSVTESRISQRVAACRAGRATVVFTDAPAWKAVADRVVGGAEELSV